MNQEEFLQRLCTELASLSDMERARVVDYYREMICDGVENGEDEKKLIAGFGSPQEIAAQILAETQSVAANVQPEQSTSSGYSARPGSYTARSDVHSILIDARHTSVEVRTVPSGPVQVHFEPGENDRVSFREENGVFIFRHTMQLSLFHWRALFSGPRKIVMDIPASFAGSLSVTTCNARLNACGLEHLTTAQFTTSNGHLKLKNIICDSLNAATSNGAVGLQCLRGNTCTVETSNGRITAEDCGFPTALKLYTGNGSIRIHNARSDNLEFATNNAAVSGTIIGDMREYAVRSHTSNASNTLPPELVYPEQTKSLNVSTSNAKIDVHFISGGE